MKATKATKATKAVKASKAMEATKAMKAKKESKDTKAHVAVKRLRVLKAWDNTLVVICITDATTVRSIKTEVACSDGCARFGIMDADDIQLVSHARQRAFLDEELGDQFADHEVVNAHHADEEED